MKVKKCPKCKSHNVKVTDDIEYAVGGIIVNVWNVVII